MCTGYSVGGYFITVAVTAWREVETENQCTLLWQLDNDVAIQLKTDQARGGDHIAIVGFQCGRMSSIETGEIRCGRASKQGTIVNANAAIVKRTPLAVS